MNKFNQFIKKDNIYYIKRLYYMYIYLINELIKKILYKIQRSDLFSVKDIKDIFIEWNILGVEKLE